MAAYSWRPSQLEVGAGGDGLLTSAALLRCQDNGHTRCADLVIILLHWLETLLTGKRCLTAHTKTWNADKDHDWHDGVLALKYAAPRVENKLRLNRNKAVTAHMTACLFSAKRRTDVS